MDTLTHDTKAPRRTVSLTINSDLMAQARAAKINVSAVSEAALIAALAERRREELRAALAAEAEAYDRHREEYGSFSEAVMAWRDANGA